MNYTENDIEKLAEEGEELRCLLLSQSGKLRDVSFELFLVLFRIEVSVVILLVWMMSRSLVLP